MQPESVLPNVPAPARVSGSEPSAARPRGGVRGLVVLCCAVLAGLLVAGAAVIRPGGNEETVLRGFQIRVLSISQAAAENRMDGALAALQALEKDLNDAAAAGRLSAARYRGIETALSAVRADLASQVAAASTAAAAVPSATEAAPPEAGNAANETASVAPAAPAPALAPAPAGPASQQDSSQEQGSSQGQDTAREAKGKGKAQGKP